MTTDMRVDRFDHNYDERRIQREVERKLLKKQSARDVGNRIGEPKDKERRKKGEARLLDFALIYFKNLFPLSFSEIHYDIINRFEDTINNGAMYCCACPRGFGKTTLAKVALIWAVITGRSRFAVLVANNAGRGIQLGDDVLRMLSSNQLLAEDFPEVVVPFRESDCSQRRLQSVTYNGEPIHADVKKGRIVLPNIPGSLSAESLIVTTGLTGSVRGLNYVTSSGEALRPDLVLCDDVQDAESAVSPTQTDGRYSILMSDVLGLAGAKGISCMITATVIASDDLAEKMLDNPEFHGHRYSLLKSFPKDMGLWKEWNEIRLNEARNNDYENKESNAFYKKHFDAMNEGAEVAWKERYNPKQDNDALEAAMKLYFRDPISFFSEYQNKPQKDLNENKLEINKEKFGLACDGASQKVCPVNSDFCTAYIDVHKNVLFYCVTAFDRAFNGRLVEYGAYPEQGVRLFTQSAPRITMSDVWDNAPIEACLAKSLGALVDQLSSTSYMDEEGNPIPLVKIGIDANWGDQTDTVYTFIRNKRDVRIYPTHGQFFGVTKDFNGGWIKKEDRVGLHWRIPRKRKDGLSYILIDSNYWKTFLFNRISSPLGVEGRITVYGSSVDHPLLSKHLSAEKATEVMTKDKRQMVWTLKANRDNHLLDCFVNCCVLANLEGAVYQDVVAATSKQKSRRAMAYKALRASAERGDL